jgi:Flp pilus assembly protein TadD
MARQRVRSFLGMPRWRGVAAVLGLGALALVVVSALGGDEERAPGTAGLDLVLAQLEDRVRTDPQDPEARIAVAIAYTERGLLTDAIAQYEQALVLEPDQQTALIGLGQAQLQLGNLDQAEEALARVAELNVDNERRYIIEQLQGVYHDLGRIAIERGQLEVASERFNEALLINKTDADTWRLLGEVYEQLDDLEQAEAAFQVAVRLVPDYVEVYEAMEALYGRTGNSSGQAYALGMLALTRGDSEAAVASLERAVEGAPEMAEAHEGLAVAYEASGRAEEALAEYRLALELDPQMFLSDLAVDRLTGS